MNYTDLIHFFDTRLNLTCLGPVAHAQCVDVVVAVSCASVAAAAGSVWMERT